MTTRLLMLAVAMGLVDAFIAAQVPDDHAQQHARATAAAGFDEATATRHFYLYVDGGAIQVTANDVTDARNLAAIHAFLQHASEMFRAGDFTVPYFVHEANVPGVETMAKFVDRIRFVYQKMQNGGRVRVSTQYIRAREAIHQFLRYQILDRKTGDSLAITPVLE